MQKKTIWITAAAAGAVLVLGGTGIAYAVTDGFEQDDDLTPAAIVQSDDDAVDAAPTAPVAEGWLDKASAAAIEAAGGGTVTGADVSDDADHTYSVDVRREDGTEVDVDLDANFAVVRLDEDGVDAAEPLDAEDAPISATDRAAAEKAALAATGKGSVTDVERSDDRDHAWEVEVTFANGTDVDVELTKGFDLVRIDK